MIRHHSKHRRPAAAMMVALVVVLVVGLITGLSLKAILRSARHTREEQQRLQAELLADAALSRAVLQLQKDPAWKGETWTVNTALATPLSKSTGSADIRVETKPSQPESFKISVVAIYPAEPVHRAQARREMTLTPASRGEKP